MHILDLRECPQHLEQLARWHHAEWSYLSPDKSFEERLAGMQVYLNDDFMPTTWVAVNDDGEVLGSAATRAYDMDTHMHLSPWLASVFVSPDHRKQGIGSALVRQVMAACKADGIETLYLFTPDQAPLYAKIGWQIMEEYDYHGNPVTVMSVDL